MIRTVFWGGIINTLAYRTLVLFIFLHSIQFPTFQQPCCPRYNKLKSREHPKVICK